MCLALVPAEAWMGMGVVLSGDCLWCVMLQSGLSRVGYTVVTRDKAQTMRLVNRDVRPLANEKRQDGTARAKPKVGHRLGRSQAR